MLGGQNTYIFHRGNKELTESYTSFPIYIFIYFLIHFSDAGNHDDVPEHEDYVPAMPHFSDLLDE